MEPLEPPLNPPLHAMTTVHIIHSYIICMHLEININ